MCENFTTFLVKERGKAEKRNRRLRQQLADYRVPEVMEYVSEKKDLYEVEKKVRSWERKVEIAEVCVILLNRTYRKVHSKMIQYHLFSEFLKKSSCQRNNGG